MTAETSTRIYEGDVVTMKGRDFYVTAASGGSLQMLGLADMKDYTGRVGAGLVKRTPTEGERDKVFTHLQAQAALAAQFTPGVLVNFKNPGRPDETVLHVVTASNEKTVTLFPVGGSNTGRYIRASRALLKVVDPADVLK